MTKDVVDVEIAEDIQMVGPGEQLREARQACGLSLEDVAERMKLKPARIAEIEQDQYDGIANVTFVRGYLRSYAKLVKLPEQQVLDAWHNLGVAAEQEAEMQSYSRRLKNESHDNRLVMTSYLVAAALLALSLLWWWQEGEQAELLSAPAPAAAALESPASTDPAPEVTAPDAEPAAPALAYQAPAEIAPAEIVPDSSDTPSVTQTETQVAETQVTETTAIVEPVAAEPEMAATETASPEPAAVVSEPVETEVPVEVSAEGTGDAAPEDTSLPSEPVVVAGRLQMQFSDDCWIQVKDASGKNLVAGIRNGNSPVDVQGKPPYQLVIGAPGELVALSFEGTSLELGDHPADKVLRLTVPVQ